MIPRQDEVNIAMLEGIKEEIAPSLTHRMHINSMRIYGVIDDLEALKQMIYKQINTEKGVHQIYPNFGLQLQDLYGQQKEYVYLELIRRIEECLIRDDRVISVTDFNFDVGKSVKDELAISFTVNSVYGEIDIINTWPFDYDNRG